MASRNLQSLKSAYLPIENVKEYNSKIYDSLMQILNTPGKSDDIKEKATGAIFTFMKGIKDAEELGVDWLQKGFIHTKDNSEKSLY